MASPVGNLKAPQIGVEYTVDGQKIVFQDARKVHFKDEDNRYYKLLYASLDACLNPQTVFPELWIHTVVKTLKQHYKLDVTTL